MMDKRSPLVDQKPPSLFSRMPKIFGTKSGKPELVPANTLDGFGNTDSTMKYQSD